MGNELQKRPWFQIHLSTAMVLMFLAGGFMWANTRNQVSGFKGRVQDHTQIAFAQHFDLNTPHLTPEVYGWPLFAYANGILFTERDYASRIRPFGPPVYFQYFKYWSEKCLFYPLRAVIDGLAFILILLSVTLVCEYRIRRKREKS